ncbi:hypothetical protein [Flexibacterium corallicola]|uniref:hypothetical protein n=1 Tax=Flexibacterium corallicola TaxID=3037259 RepID=UPI00286F5E15|nr:hypothetical protein [Pseudovibrio sp. M1P-2-3]
MENEEKVNNKTSALGQITGFSVIGSTVKSSINYPRAAYTRTKQTIDLLRSPSRKTRTPDLDDSLDEHDKFQLAQSFYRTSERNIEAAVKNTFRSFYLYLIMMGLQSVYVIWKIYGSSISSLMVFVQLSVFIMLSALAFRCSYTNYIFRTRSLPTIVSYLKSGRLLPSKQQANL